MNKLVFLHANCDQVMVGTQDNFEFTTLLEI